MSASGAVIRKVGVVGAGLMGAGIGEICARANLDVVDIDSKRWTSFDPDAEVITLPQVLDSLVVTAYYEQAS